MCNTKKFEAIIIFLVSWFIFWCLDNFFCFEDIFLIERCIFSSRETFFCDSRQFFRSRTQNLCREIDFILNFSSFNQFFALAHKILCREIDFYIFEAIFWFLFIQKLKTAFQISTCVIKSQSRSLNSMDSKISDRSPLKIRAFLTFG